MTRSPLSEPAERELASFRNHQGLALMHFQKADAHLEKLLGLLNSSGPVVPTSSVRCVRVWTQYLKENGPDYKKNIFAATGTKFTEHGTPHTIKWDEGVTSDTLNVADDTLVRFTGIRHEGRGGAPVIFALWSQRYEVYPKFGVGPKLPGAQPPAPVFEEDTESEDEALLGVISPEMGGSEPVFESAGRCLDLDEWELMHADLVTAVTKYGAKPTPDENKLLRETCPEGTDHIVAIAMLFAGRLDELK